MTSLYHSNQDLSRFTGPLVIGILEGQNGDIYSDKNVAPEGKRILILKLNLEKEFSEAGSKEKKEELFNSIQRHGAFAVAQFINGQIRELEMPQSFFDKARSDSYEDVLIELTPTRPGKPGTYEDPKVGLRPGLLKGKYVKVLTEGAKLEWVEKVEKSAGKSWFKKIFS